MEKKKVYCVTLQSKCGYYVFEICSSYEVAAKHLLYPCYDSFRGKLKIEERYLWDD